MTEPSTRLWTGEDLSDAEFTAITELLRDRRHFDLGQYKDRCIRRRIAKRLRFCQVTNFAAYLKHLEMDRDELDTLLATISIHVSQFFRNPDTFRILEQIILPDLCRRARAAGRNQLTLWSAGCASGEEPYSLALLVDDMAANDLDIRILATDISEPVLETARNGVFDALRLKEVPAAVIDKYFRIVNGHYQLIERIRDKVAFRRHNIMTASDFPTRRPDPLPQRADLFHASGAGTHPGPFHRGTAGRWRAGPGKVGNHARQQPRPFSLGVPGGTDLSPHAQAGRFACIYEPGPIAFRTH